MFVRSGLQGDVSEWHKIPSREGAGALARGAALALRAWHWSHGRRCAELTGGQCFMSMFHSFLGSGVFVKLTIVIKHLVSNLAFHLQ